MKKNLSYRDKLLELSRIYKISEVQAYDRNKKYLTTPQIAHILKKNKVPIPTELNKSIFEIQGKKIFKPIYLTGNKIGDFFSSILDSIFKFFVLLKKLTINLLRSILKFASFISKLTVKFFNSVYNLKFETKKANQLVSGIIVSAFLFLFVVAGFYAKDNLMDFYTETFQNEKIKKKIVEIFQNEKIEKKIVEKKEIEPKVKPKQKKADLKPSKPKVDKKSDLVTEFVLPNLNLKTETVLNLFEDVQYDLRRVRNEKRVKPIYFTQFPKDLDEIKDTKLKKETFIKIVLPLVVAENEKILYDRMKLKKILSKKITTDKEKSWLRQKLREYKVKNSDVKELKKRMDIIPISIALAQAAKESGWGTSRFALEGNAIFGQWTWTGQGIEPLDKSKHEGHKVLRFPILRASVKAYKNNLNTHKGYSKFREKRFTFRKKNKSIKGLSLTETLGNYAQTGKVYTKVLEKIIVQNSLDEFENVLLSNSVVKKQLDL